MIPVGALLLVSHALFSLGLYGILKIGRAHV